MQVSCFGLKYYTLFDWRNCIVIDAAFFQHVSVMIADTGINKQALKLDNYVKRLYCTNINKIV